VAFNDAFKSYFRAIHPGLLEAPNEFLASFVHKTVKQFGRPGSTVYSDAWAAWVCS